MGFYGTYAHRLIESQNDNESLIYKQSILTEMNISKNDLKDPDILKKVLEKSKKEQDTANLIAMTCPMLLGLAADVIAGIISGSILVSIGLFIPFIVGAAKLTLKILEDLPIYENKNLNKLSKKAEDLKNKTMKLKDSKEKEEIIKNCDNILKAINKRESSRTKAVEKAKYKKDVDFINNIIKLSKGENGYIPEYLSEVYNIYYVADKLGIAKPQELDKAIVKICSNDKSDGYGGILELFFGEESIDKIDSRYSDEINKLEKLIPGFKQNARLSIIYAIDDTIFFYNPKNKKFGYGDYDADSLTFDSSLYNLSKKLKYNDSTPTKEDMEVYKSIYENIKNKS